MKSESLELEGIRVHATDIIAEPKASAIIRGVTFNDIEIKSNRIEYNEQNYQQSSFDFELITVDKDKKKSSLHLSGTFNPLDGKFEGTWRATDEDKQGKLQMRAISSKTAKVSIVKQDGKTSEETMRVNFKHLKAFEDKKILSQGGD